MLEKAFYYNERKVTRGKAMLHYAHLYPKETDLLSKQERLRRLQHLVALRPDVEVNTLHIYVNFDPSETLDKNTLVAISQEYMEKIGFGRQPYLVYEHFDAGHPHLHILTTCIEKTGDRIDTHLIGKLKSSSARVMLEQKYGLVKAAGRGKTAQAVQHPSSLQPVQYGVDPTKQAVAEVVRSVVAYYKFGSLIELNAVLSLYNVEATRGGPDTRTFKTGGLMYSAIDLHGRKDGLPIKASRIAGRPVLKTLETIFIRNKRYKKALKPRSKAIIDDILDKGVSLDDFVAGAEENGISVLLRRGEGGNLYGITYIDKVGMAVFNGSDLGKRYTAKAIMDRVCIENTMVEGKPIGQYIAEVIAITPFAKGVRAVLSYWTNKGLCLSCNDASEPSYKLGFFSGGENTYWPLGKKLNRYLMVNNIRSTVVDGMRKGMDQIFNANMKSSESYIGHEISGVHSDGFKNLNAFWDSIFAEPLPEDDYVSQELLKEARKKKRRKRQ